MSKQQTTIDKSFKDWTLNDLFFYLGVKQKKESELLNSWLTVANPIMLSDFEETYLIYFCEQASLYIRSWNEAELRDNFISSILSLVNFHSTTYYFSPFAERKITTKINNINLYGKVDWMVAIGQGEPQVPFFFIHEYKKEKGTENDPLGQLLATMVAAQTLNGKPFQPNFFNPLKKHDPDMPIYGCYIIGRNWFFVILENKEYTVSQAYNATKLEELKYIFHILKKQKRMIINKLHKTN